MSKFALPLNEFTGRQRLVNSLHDPYDSYESSTRNGALSSSLCRKSSKCLSFTSRHKSSVLDNPRYYKVRRYYEVWRYRRAVHSQERSISNFLCSFTRNISSHSMKNLALHRLLMGKMIILPIYHYLTYAFMFYKVVRMYFLNLHASLLLAPGGDLFLRPDFESSHLHRSRPVLPPCNRSPSQQRGESGPDQPRSARYSGRRTVQFKVNHTEFWPFSAIIITLCGIHGGFLTSDSHSEWSRDEGRVLRRKM